GESSEGVETMRIRLTLFVLLLIGAMQAPGQACPPPNPLPNPLPPDPMLPMLLNCTRPETGLSFLGGAGNGISWRFADGSAVELCPGMRGIPHVIRRHPFRETETFRSTLVTGTHAGIDSEWYLGHGFSARLDIGVMPL